MTKASRWFTNLFGGFNRRRRHKPLPNTATSSDGGGSGGDVVQESKKHAVAVAAATAAVAEAALAAAKAAAEVVRLTDAGGPVVVPDLYVGRRWSVVEFAAVKIQSAFRGYLARRALKALKGLVKIQALVRGHLVRKQSAAMLRSLQALVRVQGRARTNRVLTSAIAHSGRENSIRYKLHISTQNPEDASAFKRCVSASNIRSDTKARSNPQLAQNWLDNWVEAGSSVINSTSSMRISRNDDTICDKILEIDSWNPHSKPKSQRITVQDYYNHSFTSSNYLSKYIPVNPNEIQKPCPNWDAASLKSGCYPQEETYPCEVKSVYGRKSPMTPMRDEWSNSPSYMAYTESSRAKSRSQSVPRQRGDYERRGFSKKSLQAFWDRRNSSKRIIDPFTNSSK